MQRVLGVLLLLLLAVRMCLGPAKRLQPAAALRTTPAELTQLVDNCEPIAGVRALKTALLDEDGGGEECMYAPELADDPAAALQALGLKKAKNKRKGEKEPDGKPEMLSLSVLPPGAWTYVLAQPQDQSASHRYGKATQATQEAKGRVAAFRLDGLKVLATGAVSWLREEGSTEVTEERLTEHTKGKVQEGMDAACGGAVGAQKRACYRELRDVFERRYVNVPSTGAGAAQADGDGEDGSWAAGGELDAAMDALREELGTAGGRWLAALQELSGEFIRQHSTVKQREAYFATVASKLHQSDVSDGRGRPDRPAAATLKVPYTTKSNDKQGGRFTDSWPFWMAEQTAAMAHGDKSKATTAPALAKAEREREAVSFKLLEWVVGEGNVPTYVLSMLNNLPGSEGKHKLFSREMERDLKEFMRAFGTLGIREPIGLSARQCAFAARPPHRSPRRRPLTPCSAAAGGR